MSVSHVSDSKPVKSLTEEYTKKFDDALADVRIKKIMIGAFAGLTALALAGMAGAMAAWIIVPLSMVGGFALFCAAMAVTMVAVYYLVGSYHIELSGKQHDLTKIFTELLGSDQGKLSEEKMKLFQKYGTHCTELKFDNTIRLGIEQGVFFDWLLDEKRKDAITNKEAREYIQSLNTEENRKILKSHSDFSSLSIEFTYSILGKMEMIAEAKDYEFKETEPAKAEKEKKDVAEILTKYPKFLEKRKATFKDKIEKSGTSGILDNVKGFDHNEPIPQEYFCSRKQVVELLKCFPNLKEISPNLEMERCKEVRQAYTKKEIVVDKFMRKLASKWVNEWQEKFPGIKV